MRRDHVLQFVLEAAQTPDFQGVTAQAVADALSIWRNDAAVELNRLVAEGKLRRVGKKNVRFFPASEETADIRPEPAVQEEPPQAEEETGQYRAFSGLVGADGSLTGYAGGIERKIVLLCLEGADTARFRIPKKGTAL